jgi:hypothetical protein
VNVLPRRAGRAASLPLFAAVAALCGCQIFDTRPAVVVLPFGVLVGKDWIDIRVEAGGAPTARILVDGTPVGDPVSTDEDVRLDISKVAEGVHELVARVEQSSAPRTSAPQRLEVRRVQHQVKVEMTAPLGPWDPTVVEVRSPDPVTRMTASARDGAGNALPCEAPVPSTDHRTWTVAVGGGTLSVLGSLVVDAEATDYMGFKGSGRLALSMPTRILVTFRQPSGETVPPVRIVATPAVPVPSATLWVSGVGRPAMPLREVGRSPWDVTLAENELASGAYSFEFRRADVELDGQASLTVREPGKLGSCSVEGGGTAVTPARCGVVTYRLPPYAVTLEGTAFGEAPPGDLALVQESAASWRICPTDLRWKRGPVSFVATVAARDAGGGVVEWTRCDFTLGWQWADPGADPVTDGAAPLRGTVLAVHAPSPAGARIALQGQPGTADEGTLRIATRAAGPGSFTLGEPYGGSTAGEAAAVLGPASALAWTRAPAHGIAEGLLQESLGAAWTPWPLSSGTAPGVRSPSLAADQAGPRAVAWVEEGAEGTSVVQVRWAGAAWALLAPITPSVPGARIENPSIAPAGPGAMGPHVAFLEVAPDESQRPRVVAWDGKDWLEMTTGALAVPFGPRSTDAARVHLAADASRAWIYLRSRAMGIHSFEWKGSYWLEGPAYGNLEPPSGLIRVDALAVGVPSDGRASVAVHSFTRPDGQAEVWACPTLWRFECSSLGPTSGAPHAAIAIDPDSMTVAWTASDGTVHVRTLTP